MTRGDQLLSGAMKGDKLLVRTLLFQDRINTLNIKPRYGTGRALEMGNACYRDFFSRISTVLSARFWLYFYG